MFSSVISASISGLDVCQVTVEADVSDGLPTFMIVGFASSQVKEAQERVRTALKNIGITMPPKRVTINLSPVNIRKEGAGFDLPVAVAILCALGRVRESAFANMMIAGEISLSGKINAIPGILAIVMKAKELGCRKCLVPEENMEEAVLVQDMEIIGANSLKDVIAYSKNMDEYRNKRRGDPREKQIHRTKYDVDFEDIRYQTAAKRAAEIAVSGFHNMLLMGPPGTGKTMIARRIPTILPPLTWEESLELTQIYSIAGLLSKEHPILTERQFRAPHHTISPQALAGGGRNPKPGEITLAHRSVLFLDEMPEFSKKALEVMRQPLEDRKIQLTRVRGTYVFPADFLLIGAMNPCPCGFYPDRNRCNCNPAEIKKYMGKISQPLLDRMDLCVEISPLTYEQMTQSQKGESSQKIRERVEKTHKIQKKRYQNRGFQFNAEIPAADIEQYCKVDEQGNRILKNAFETMQLSGRGYHRVLKVARTIADMDGKEEIGVDHIKEALGYRVPDKKSWR